MTSYNSPFTGQVIQPTDVSFRAFSIAANTALDWPINGNVNGDYAARIMEVSATTVGLSLAMPPANQTSVGQDALIRNTGSNAFTVTGYAGGAIVTVAAGEAKYIYIETNATTAGTWGVIAFGVGTSNVSASELAGSGLVARANTLNLSHPATSFATGETLAESDRANAKMWSGGVGSVLLTAASTLGNNWFVLLKNNGTGSLTVTPNSPDLIDGAATKVFNPNESAFIICTGTSFITVGYGVSTQFAFTALVKSVTGGAYTLTASEASNAIQEYVGTLASNVTVTYPPIVNFYVVSNQVVDNGYTLTLTTGVVGGATALVPPGQQATLICDGTNFLNANTAQVGATSISLVNGTVSAPSVKFASETNTGIYRPGAGQLGLAVLGALILTAKATGVEVTGTGNFTGGLAGGTF